MVGKTIKVDPTTALNVRGKFARVCVEIDLNKRLKPSVVINGRRYKVVYEGFQQICFTCGKFGHCKDECPEIPMKEGQAAEPSVKEAQKTKSQQPSADNPYGPWMIAERRRKWNPNKNKPSQQHESNKSDARKGQSSSKAEKIWVEKGSLNAAQANGSRFGVLIDETETEDIEIDETVADIVTDEAIPENLINNSDVPEVVMQLRDEVQKIQSHGGPAVTKEVHKDASAKPSTSRKASDLASTSKQEPRNMKGVDKGILRQPEHGRRNDLRLQGHQMKRSASSKQKTASRVALLDVSNDPRKAAKSVLQGKIKILHRATPPAPQVPIDHVKMHPPDIEKPPGFESLAKDSSLINATDSVIPLYEAEVSDTHPVHPPPPQ